MVLGKYFHQHHEPEKVVLIDYFNFTIRTQIKPDLYNTIVIFFLQFNLGWIFYLQYSFKHNSFTKIEIKNESQNEINFGIYSCIMFNYTVSKSW